MTVAAGNDRGIRATTNGEGYAAHDLLPELCRQRTGAPPAGFGRNAGWAPPMSAGSSLTSVQPEARAPSRWFYAKASALLLTALIAEGFDLQAANFAAPDLVRALGIEKAALGPLLSASLFGVLLGAPLIGALGDRVGRKRLIVVACAAYGVLSLIAAQVDTLWALVVLRFLIGLGLGGVLPNALALAGELVPERRRANATALVGIGITLGGVIAGAVAAALLPDHGWRSLFIVGGIGPLGIALLLYLWLPESPAFLRLRESAAAAGGERPAAAPGSGGIAALFRGPMRRITPLIWLIFIAVLMTVYLLSGWIPVLLGEGGFSMREAALVATGYHAGGVAGGIVASCMIGRSAWPVVIAFLTGACLFLALLVWGGGSTELTVVGLIAAGFCVTGAQNAINGAAGVAYPTEQRSKGLGWALGIGRVGSIAGPLVGSVAISLGMGSARDLFMLPLVPLAVAGLAAVWLARAASSRGAAIE